MSSGWPQNALPRTLPWAGLTKGARGAKRACCSSLEGDEVAQAHSLGQVEVGRQGALHAGPLEVLVGWHLPQQQAHQGQPLGGCVAEALGSCGRLCTPAPWGVAVRCKVPCNLAGGGALQESLATWRVVVRVGSSLCTVMHCRGGCALLEGMDLWLPVCSMPAETAGMGGG